MSNASSPFPELTEVRLRQLLEQPPSPRFAVFFYTPLCGTCKVAERMLHIAQQTGPIMPVYRMNVNFGPWFVRKWEIRSIPCLVLFDNGSPKQFRYAMRSVQELYETLK